ncbi:hypothetical protein [Nitrosarchaeum sp. AC2]|uniref:hypothetical protein n=1 Tax=Nitrosarchaeum sp. AC2 TaxID=2259673 RepID=UPI0015C96510|nr:hypothetical protein [Nitrosarchaeum sp. AC2]QLH10729.1 hypothetical protein DSQ20_04025 [Nitrosarchaeum sp. AC2]
MKGDVLLQNIKVSGLVPLSTGKKAKETKLLIREAVLTKLGKNISNVQKRCTGKQLSISIVFYLHKAKYSKKDLSGLSDAVVKILGKEMSTKKDALKGLEIVTDPSLICRIILEKNLIKKDAKEEFSFSIYEWG